MLSVRQPLELIGGEDGAQATCYPAFQQSLLDAGVSADVVAHDVVVDGHFGKFSSQRFPPQVQAAKSIY